MQYTELKETSLSNIKEWFSHGFIYTSCVCTILSCMHGSFAPFCSYFYSDFIIMNVNCENKGTD